jgi:hypothetical protein
MQIRKKERMKFKKILSSETTEPTSTKLCWNDPWVVPFQNCVRQRRPVSKMKKILFLVMAAILDTGGCWRAEFWKGTTQGSFQQSLVEIGSVVSPPVSKMAAMTKNRIFFKWPKRLYFKPESAQIWTV